MNKVMKVAMSIMMSFAMVVCLASTEAEAKAVSAQEYDISLARVNIGVPYHIQDKWGKLTAQYTGQGTLVVTYTDLSKISRYISMYVTSSSKSFKVRNFVVKANTAHSESYNLRANSTSRVTITVYRHTSTKPSSGEIDPLTGTMPD